MWYLLYYSLIFIILQYDFLLVVNFFYFYRERICLKKNIGFITHQNETFG